MSECKLDHTHDDVIRKFEQQQEYLPEDLKPLLAVFFEKEHTQVLLNEVFHLLKKFDLSSDEEKLERINRLSFILKNV
ncbi:group-specific protein [Bacillus sp. FJAT-49705]|uniref:Group-specific protein n=1 Tax=Cytobacillus citreus TaxID=2833586 RepID=A0ABS5NNF4_9BACI|nr:group-specific protein [Cytobacillus citreus]MBS4189369.1 group-specific protein [Cytobacillus citreus]